jgi:hypothetical protein
MNQVVTIFPSIKQTENPVHITIQTALSRISTGGKHIQIVREVRSGNKEAKKQLPIILWSGKFSERKDTALEEHSGFIVLDFDHIDVEGSKNVLATDQYVFSCWISPSGEGLKALVKVSNPHHHRDHFRALQAYYDKEYGLEVDPSGINVSRACFDSYDPDIVINESSNIFGQMISEKALSQKAEQQGRYTDYNKLAVVSSMIRRADDGEKHAILLKSALLCGGYISAGRMEEEEAIRVLEREIIKRDVDSIETARNTIRDGIEKGKTMPIREFIENENSAKLEMMISDGDMSFISSEDEDYRWIQDYIDGKLTLGLSTGDLELDKYFLFKRDFTIINGISNIGKSTFSLYTIVSSAVNHGWKWIIFSAENRTAATKMKIIQFACNARVADLYPNELKKMYSWVNEHFTVVSNNSIYSYTDLIIFGEKLLRQGDYDGYFIDPYNSLKIQMSSGSALSTHEYHYEAASELLNFTQKHNLSVWLSTHAVTEAQRRKGDDGLPQAPYAEDTEGGGKFVNKSDNFLTFHRKIQHANMDIRRTVEVHVRKIREVESGGEPTSIDYPVLFEMNMMNTGFINKSTRKPMFVPILKQEPQQLNIGNDYPF